ncbi:MAG TPA: Holliday junction branch migration protein RuvA [Longimicrobium sp.]
MIARIRGELVMRDLERVEVMTPGGVCYEILIPNSVFERLPKLGEEVTLRTYQIVREDALILFGFIEDVERTVFARLLTANGVGPRLAMAMVGALGATSVVRAIREKNVAALVSVSGVGKKTAERIVLDLTGKLDDVALSPAGVGARAPGVEEAMRALGALGVTQADADRAIRLAVQDLGQLPAPQLIREALARLK